MKFELFKHEQEHVDGDRSFGLLRIGNYWLFNLDIYKTWRPFFEIQVRSCIGVPFYGGLFSCSIALGRTAYNLSILSEVFEDEDILAHDCW